MAISHLLVEQSRSKIAGHTLYSVWFMVNEHYKVTYKPNTECMAMVFIYFIYPCIHIDLVHHLLVEQSMSKIAGHTLSVRFMVNEHKKIYIIKSILIII